MNDQQRRSDIFLRGLMTGAVVGAVIAGSTLWERRRRKAGTAGAEAGAEVVGAGDGVDGALDGVASQPFEPLGAEPSEGSKAPPGER